jgi:hemin uptake protein HemP
MKPGAAPRDVVAAASARTPAASAAAPATSPPRRLSSRELLGGAVEIEIEHDAQIYRLRRTSPG